MRERAVLFALLLAAAAPGHAQRATTAPWMTGARLLERLDPVDPDDITLSPQSVLPTKQLVAEHRNMMNHEFVQGYIEAAHDASEGKVWCFDERHQVPNPEDFWNESIWGLRGLPKSQLKRNASELLAEIWRTKWACAPTHQRQQ